MHERLMKWLNDIELAFSLHRYRVEGYVGRCMRTSNLNLGHSWMSDLYSTQQLMSVRGLRNACAVSFMVSAYVGKTCIVSTMSITVLPYLM